MFLTQHESLSFRGEILYTPRNPITENLMKNFNKSFETFEEFRSFAQPFGSLYVHLKDIENYKDRAELLTTLLNSRFFEEYSESNIGSVYGIDFQQFKNSNATSLYESIKNNLNVLDVTNQATRYNFIYICYWKQIFVLKVSLLYENQQGQTCRF